MAGAGRFILLIALIASTQVSIFPSLANLSVCPGGCDYPTVQAAVNVAGPNETIWFNSSNCPGGFDLDRNVTLRGLDSGRGRPTLGMNSEPIVISADGVTIRGFKLEQMANSTVLLAIRSRGNRIYLNDMPYGSRIISVGQCFWNSSQPINYQYNGATYQRYMGNFWMDYSGRDENGDGIGDQPMVIDSHNKDYYPLMAPVSSYSVPGEMKETGGIIKARVGKPFVITLKCRGAYKWFLDFDYHMVRQDSHEMEGEDIEVFTFTPLKAGKTEVVGVYRQPWGNIVTDTKGFKVEISNDAGIVLTTREAVRLDSRGVAK